MLRKKHGHGDLKRGWDLPDNALSHGLREFLDWTAAMSFSDDTVRQRSRGVRRFILWCVERGLNQPHEVTLSILERYQRHLYHYRKGNGEPLSFGSQASELVPIKAYFKWLTRTHRIPYNPAAELMLPKLPRRLPRNVLSVTDIETILNQPDVATPSGLRDRAMLEVFYSSGVRRTELARLRMIDVDTKRGSLFVREGKGAKDRLVPLGERACGWVMRYLLEVRPLLLASTDDGTLFLADYGEAFHPDTLGDYVKQIIVRAGITVPGACHLFRHACATHMLENGADIRFIQALLGHTDLTSTQIYTQVSIVKLKEIHDATHPARLKRAGSAQTRVDEGEPRCEAESAASGFLGALDAEAGEEDGGANDAVAADARQAARR